MLTWKTPIMGDILVVKIEPANRHDKDAVAIYRDDAVAIYRDAKIVDHVPYNLAPRISAFLMR